MEGKSFNGPNSSVDVEGWEEKLVSIYKPPPSNSAFSHPSDRSQWGLAGRLLCNGPAAISDAFFVGLGCHPVQGQCTDALALRSRVSPVHPLTIQTCAFVYLCLMILAPALIGPNCLQARLGLSYQVHQPKLPMNVGNGNDMKLVDLIMMIGLYPP